MRIEKRLTRYNLIFTRIDIPYEHFTATIPTPLQDDYCNLVWGFSNHYASAPFSRTFTKPSPTCDPNLSSLNCHGSFAHLCRDALADQAVISVVAS